MLFALAMSPLAMIFSVTRDFHNLVTDVGWGPWLAMIGCTAPFAAGLWCQRSTHYVVVFKPRERLGTVERRSWFTNWSVNFPFRDARIEEREARTCCDEHTWTLLCIAGFEVPVSVNDALAAAEWREFLHTGSTALLVV